MFNIDFFPMFAEMEKAVATGNVESLKEVGTHIHLLC